MDDAKNKLKVEFNFPEEWEKVGCPICQSPFHEEKNCPKPKAEESKFKFRSRKELRLESGDLPFKFRIDIDPQVDDEIEVTRKRALLRLNSSKIYNLMGFSIKAHESQKATLQWLVRMADELNIDDPTLQEERNRLLPLIQTLQDMLPSLTRIREVKIKQAEAMEEVLTKSRTKARQVRVRVSKKIQQDREFWVLRLPDSTVDVPIFYDTDPANLFKEAAEAILEKEKSKEAERNPEEDES